MMQKFGEYVLWQRAQEYVRTNNIIMIGVAGSYGSSLTAQAIALVLRNTGKTVRTNSAPVATRREAALAILGVNHPASRPGWWRFLIGSRVKEIAEPEPQIIVINIKAQKPGDVDALASALPFSVGVLTAIYAQALHLFQSMQMVAHEYESLLANLPKNGLAVINREDSYVIAMAKHFICPVVTIGTNSDADVEFVRVNRLGLTGFAGEVRVGKNAYEFLLPHLAGKHQLNAVAFALALAYRQGLDIKQAVHSLQALEPVRGDLSIVPGHNNSLILDDTSDATAQSVLLALKILASLPAQAHEHVARRIAILGDIVNLGAESITKHMEIGKTSAQVCDILVVVGEAMKYAQSSALTESGIDTHHFDNSQDVGKWLKDYLRAGDVVLISGSKEMRMQHVVEALKQ